MKISFQKVGLGILSIIASRGVIYIFDKLIFYLKAGLLISDNIFTFSYVLAGISLVIYDFLIKYNYKSEILNEN